jgi:hypothetical protein
LALISRGLSSTGCPVFDPRRFESFVRMNPSSLCPRVNRVHLELVSLCEPLTRAFDPEGEVRRVSLCCLTIPPPGDGQQDQTARRKQHGDQKR